MGTSKKKIQVWKKALLHFSLCFSMGFFTGFAPRNTASLLSMTSNNTSGDGSFLQVSPQPAQNASYSEGNLNRSLLAQAPSQSPVNAEEHSHASVDEETEQSQQDEEFEEDPKETARLVIAITPVSSRLNHQFQVALLQRLANTLKLVPPPLLWVVVQSHFDSSETKVMLRKTGIMYRHLIYKENFTGLAAERDHQRNVALNHIEHHRLSGIVHFAPLSNVYRLQFFQAIREIEVLGAWPVAKVWGNKKRVVIEGPVCSASQVLGWHLRNQTTAGFPIHISGFAFNSSILWDPERWGRASSTQDNSQKQNKPLTKSVSNQPDGPD
ncbi:hypothetical protein ACLOJK_016659 [Asimina triloba]